MQLTHAIVGDHESQKWFVFFIEQTCSLDEVCLVGVAALVYAMSTSKNKKSDSENNNSSKYRLWYKIAFILNVLILIYIEYSILN